MAEFNTEELKGKAQEAIDNAGKAAAGAAEAAKPVIDEAGKKIGEAMEAAKPVVDAAAAKVAPVVEGAAAAVAPVVDTVSAKAAEVAKQTGLDKTIDTVTHDAGVVVGAAKNKVEELTGRDLDGDGKIGAGAPAEEPAAEEAPAEEPAAEEAPAEEAAAEDDVPTPADFVGEAAKAAGDFATGAKNKLETVLNKDIDGDGKIG